MLRTVAAILLAGAATIAVAQHAGTKDPPIRRYGLDDGLNQRLITSMVQDDDGYLWVGSFGGLNRFDGLRFESFTTRNGLRENLVQSLFVDTDGALWIGDAAGGLTVLDGGRTVRTIDPPDGIQSDIRGITQIGRTIFASSEYSGLYAVSMNDDSKPAYKLPFEPSESHRLVADSTGTLWLHHGDNRLGTIDPRDPNDIHDIATNVVAVALDSSGAVFVASERGHLGRIDGDAIDWFDTTDRPNLTNFVLDNDGVAWLSYGDRLIDYRDATEVIDVDVEIAAWPLVDRDGVLWLPSVGGLIRYLGNRFEHYPLNLGPDQSTVFSLLTDAKDRFWLGTATGVQVIAADGSYTDINELAGIDGGEIRGMHLSPVGDYVWVADIDNGAFRIDTDSLSMQKVFPDSAAVLMDLTIDDYGKIWASSYLGVLYRHDPASGRTQTIDLGHESAVYSMSVDSDGWLWFSWSYKGIYRLNTALDDPVPERVVAAEEIGRSLFAHINVVDTVELGRTVWLATTRGGLFRWSAATGLERHAGDSMLSDQTVFSVQPLADGTVALGTERGAYHYDPASAQLQFFGPLAGFKAVEAKTHATYIHTDGSLWFGTANGITRMDVSRPIAPSLLRAPAITSITVAENTINPALTSSPLETDAPVQIEFVAVSTVLPGNIEYSHRLRGESDLWSEPTTNRTIKFASLAAGDYTFEVRARSAGNLWSQPTEWSLSVPAPFWQSPWFIAVAAIALVLLGRGILDFRVHQVEQSNQRLRAEVDARTHAIEQARQALQDSHNRLQEEVREREKSDALRADVEARFHQAYQNAPIGMALIGTDGMVFDANPQLKAMFWPESMPEEKEVLLDVVAEHEREPFVQFFFDFVADTSINPSKEIRCLSYTGETRQIAFSLSPVTNADGDLHYVLLMANDVTESRALTDQLRYQANYDELTGLLNRRAFAQRLKETIDQSRAPEQMPYLMFLDLDRFKVVNDTCGHAAGDDLLKLAADAIVSCIREHDTVARLGGDEFALIVATNEESIAMQRAERVRRAIDSLEFYWESEVFRIGVSIGLVRISPAVSDIDEVQQLADAACYAAKESGRNRVHLVGDESDIVHERRGEMRWAHRLNYAINNDRFALFGQRITSLRPDTVDGDRFEILLRMKDQSTRKLIPPAAFLPAAERFGLQVRLDYWVVNRVTEMLKEDHHVNSATPCGYWVNLSGASINDRGFCRDVTALIRHAQLPPGSLNFEITETTAIRQIDAAAQLIEDLRELGCLFALDDFGSGLSSFDYLKRLNVDYVKIDGQFVRDIAANKTDRIFVKSIVDIAHALGVKVVAEFVETEEALAIVTELGTDYAQGFGIHRPEQLIAAQTTNVYATSTSQQAI